MSDSQELEEKQSDTYYTIEAEAEGLYSQLRSKFIGFVIPVESEEVALAKVAEIKAKYYDARHHCWAYRLGKEGERFRSNDDGEPSGTAGKPILGQLVSADLTNVLAVVVRYFGGVKLGTSGLIEAYREATIEAIANAERKTCILEDKIEVSFGYELMGEVMRYIKEAEGNIYLQDFQESCRLEFSIRQADSPRLIERSDKLYGATAQILDEE